MSHSCPRRLWPTLAAVVLLTGCGGLSLNLPPGAAAHEPGRPQSRVARIDAALQAATRFLISAQSSDGSWKSDVYGQFKQGDALTPLVLATLVDLPESPRSLEAIEQGSKYLQQFVDVGETIHAVDVPLTYPVYSAAGAVLALCKHDDARSRAACRAWLKYLRDQQLSKSLGWQPGDAQFGGWSYAKEPPRKPAPGEPLSPLAEPNLSATVFALDALRVAGVATDDPAVQAALKFIQRCQNYSEDATVADSHFDDGGFFFMGNDPVRNKAGATGTDRNGVARFASYGSATADGLRALLDCGLPLDHPRVAAALHWLDNHFAADQHPGQYAPDRQAAQNALYFYYCSSCAKALHAAALQPAAEALPDSWAESLTVELLDRQRPDGSWSNPVVDVREDDPLVATCFAVSALAACRDSLVDSPQNSAAGR